MNDKIKSEVLKESKNIFEPYADKLKVIHNTSDNFYLNADYYPKINKDLYFGSVHRKNYVSFYLIPVYLFPELLEEISDDLNKRMHGKSCFNLKKIDKKLF